MQINPNVYISITYCGTNWRLVGQHLLSFENQYCLKKIIWATRMVDYFCFRINGTLKTDNPSKKSWKKKYFFASRYWELREGEMGSSPRVCTPF